MKSQTENSIQISKMDYTSYARPTIIYVGLFFLFIEVSGLRWFILIKIDACKEVIDYSKFIFINFLFAWAAFVGVYNIARTAEKYGVKKKFVNMVVASIPQNESNYTKRARPTVIYVGLFFICCEIIGFRWIIFNISNINLSNPELQVKKEILLNTTKDIFQYFLTVWTMLVAEYGGCRTFEKIGNTDKERKDII